MSTQFLYELIGYASSLPVAISLTMRSILRLRLLNLLGSLTFSLYGVLIHAWPVAFVNAFIGVINLYYLWQMTRERDAFEILEMAPDSAYVRRFVDFYADEIRRFQPDFVYRPETPGLMAFFILRNMVPGQVPVNIFL
jgi:hypothetical protein